MATSTQSRTTIISILAVGLALAGLLAYLLRSSEDTVEVHSARVSYQDLTITIPASGVVEPVEGFPVIALTPGIVEKIYVKVGQKVQPGTLLLKINDSDAHAHLATVTSFLRAQQATLQDMQRGGSLGEMNGFQSDLSRAQMQQQQDEKDLASKQALQKQGFASAAEVTAAQQRLNNDQLTIDSVHRNTTQRFSAADMARAKAALADAEASVVAANNTIAGDEIRSKIAGTVYSITVLENYFVPVGDILMNVADLTKMQVRAYFDEPDIGQLAAGQQVSIQWAAKPNQTWHGHVERAPTEVKPYGARHVGECLITVDDATGDLLPNTNVTVAVTTVHRSHVLSIPREALHTDGTRNFVYVIRDGRLVQTPVQVGQAVNLTRAEIVSGLSENEAVALNATTNRDLTDGLKVKVVD